MGGRSEQTALLTSGLEQSERFSFATSETGEEVLNEALAEFRNLTVKSGRPRKIKRPQCFAEIFL